MEIFKPPEFSDSEPTSPEALAETFGQFDDSQGLEAPEQFETPHFGEKKKTRKKKVSYSHFNSGEFNEVETPLSNVEDYSRKVREDVNQYKKKVTDEVDLMKSEIELELASALIVKKDAEKKARELIQSAEDTRDEVHKQGRDEGFQAGFEEGRQQHKEENERDTGNILSLLNELKGMRLSVLQEYEQQTVLLSTLIAKKIVNTEIKTNKAVVLEMIRKAMHHFEGMGNVKIRLNPLEYNFIAEHQEEIATFLDEDQIVKLKVDPNVKPLAPSIECDFSAVNLDLNKQFDEIEHAMRECFEDRRELFHP